VSTRVTILGPNGGLKPTFHVHRAGCKDTLGSRYFRSECHIFDYDDEAELILDWMSDFQRENDYTDEEALAEYASEFKFFPCIHWEAK